MNTRDAANMVARYTRSHFWRPEPMQSVAGGSVPVLRGRELVAAMIDNARRSQEDVLATAARLKEARLDGLLDMDAYRTLDKERDKELRKAWLAAAGTVRGDYVRAVAEQAHWQEYAEWASEQAAAGTPRLPAPPFASDPRLPPEKDDDEEVPF